MKPKGKVARQRGFCVSAIRLRVRTRTRNPTAAADRVRAHYVIGFESVVCIVRENNDDHEKVCALCVCALCMCVCQSRNSCSRDVLQDVSRAWPNHITSVSLTQCIHITMVKHTIN